MADERKGFRAPKSLKAGDKAMERVARMEQEMASVIHHFGQEMSRMENLITVLIEEITPDMETVKEQVVMNNRADWKYLIGHYWRNNTTGKITKVVPYIDQFEFTQEGEDFVASHEDGTTYKVKASSLPMAKTAVMQLVVAKMMEARKEAGAQG